MDILVETSGGDAKISVGDVETPGGGEMEILGEGDLELSENIVGTSLGGTVIVADDTGCEISSRVRLRLLAP